MASAQVAEIAERSKDQRKRKGRSSARNRDESSLRFSLFWPSVVCESEPLLLHSPSQVYFPCFDREARKCQVSQAPVLVSLWEMAHKKAVSINM
jgi:hypothetical protein